MGSALRLTRAYILGAMHDGTLHASTIRISQREKPYVVMIQNLILTMGGKAWVYREGRRRRLYVVEFSRSFMRGLQIRSRRDRIDYARGYFDAEGGIPSVGWHEPYLYFAQKNRSDLAQLRIILLDLGISCGEIHNPSRRADPDYWRFYVGRRSIRTFAKVVGSWHPRKAFLLSRIAGETQGAAH